jgi:hypothetical protein
MFLSGSLYLKFDYFWNVLYNRKLRKVIKYSPGSFIYKNVFIWEFYLQ